jgi:hypothetical protein
MMIASGKVASTSVRYASRFSTSRLILNRPTDPELTRSNPHHLLDDRGGSMDLITLNSRRRTPFRIRYVIQRTIHLKI